MTFTPTAVGLCWGEGQGPAQPLDFQSLFTEALAKALALGLNLGGHMSTVLPEWQFQPPTQTILRPLSPTQRDSISSEDSWGGQGDQRDPEFLEHEGVLLDKPAFTTLFWPSIFKTFYFAKQKWQLIWGQL